MAEHDDYIDPAAAPSGAGCLECDETGSWWVHLRRCAKCGHVGCCDDSLNKHGTAHFRATGHRIMQSFEPGEDWFWDFGTGRYAETAIALAAPTSHPESQTVPGPAERVPADWQQLLG
ncbi:UBP-type zinc finger domain-containing protein [Herbiconiux sp.]|jgi:hypothetical protein|uniref:UBP-type zinc finger domain-containing protein n=1 Tax=Herbiconiux sp. TaxID=1871186 RepID=UPI0025B9BF7F|nr:UBP-type zinc finger domain-containing protein [Herbiconiux sp.]